MTKINYGKMKIWLGRMRNNVSYLQIAMIFYLFLDKAGFEWWYVVVGVGFLVWSYYDNSIGLIQEVDYNMTKNKRLMEMYEILKKMEDKDA